MPISNVKSEDLQMASQKKRLKHLTNLSPVFGHHREHKTPVEGQLNQVIPVHISVNMLKQTR